MSQPKFMVFKLKDLKIPFIMLLVVIAAFTFILWNKNDAAPTFAPDKSYEDGMYIANIAFSDADMDLVVNVKDNRIESVALDGFDDTERTLYSDLNTSIGFVNDYITSTQSIELPEASAVSASTSILMDAVKVALSNDQEASLTTTYETPLLNSETPAEGTINELEAPEQTDATTPVDEETPAMEDASEVTEADSEAGQN